MHDKIVVSLDTMGGSKAPRSNIEAAFIALKRHPSLHLLLYGDTDIISPLLADLAPFAQRYKVLHAPTVVSDHDQPVRALRQGVESSMRKAIDSVHLGTAKACVSGGNTGALMVMAKMVLGDLPGIKRPAIIGAIPHKHGKTIILDLGANSECDELNLLQFALMGNAYAKVVLNKAAPSIGLLNMGVEAIKGTGLQKKTHELLKDTQLNYTGFIEGYDITEGVVDVVVTDGFTGNILLKFGEGVVKLILDILKKSFNKNLFTKIAGLLMKKTLKTAFSKIDPNNVNGAMFIGINGIVVKSHGSADSNAVAAAITIAYELAAQDINQDIIQELKTMHAGSNAQLFMEKIKKTLGMGV